MSTFASFLLKPNYVVDKSPTSGLTTRPESIDGIITSLFQKVGKRPAVDTIGSAVMGYSAKECKYLQRKVWAHVTYQKSKSSAFPLIV